VHKARKGGNLFIINGVTCLVAKVLKN